MPNLVIQHNNVASLTGFNNCVVAILTTILDFTMTPFYLGIANGLNRFLDPPKPRKRHKITLYLQYLASYGGFNDAAAILNAILDFTMIP
jgi:hypothetical protein